jgi:hypothetical protein
MAVVGATDGFILLAAIFMIGLRKPDDHDHVEDDRCKPHPRFRAAGGDAGVPGLRAPSWRRASRISSTSSPAGAFRARRGAAAEARSRRRACRSSASRSATGPTMSRASSALRQSVCEDRRDTIRARCRSRSDRRACRKASWSMARAISPPADRADRPEDRRGAGDVARVRVSHSSQRHPELARMSAVALPLRRAGCARAGLGSVDRRIGRQHDAGGATLQRTAHRSRQGSAGQGADGYDPLPRLPGPVDRGQQCGTGGRHAQPDPRTHPEG